MLGVRTTIILLDVRLEVVGVGDRSEARGQCRESSDGHVVAAVPDMGAASASHRGNGLGSGLVIWI
jgi:hypothetical protein